MLMQMRNPVYYASPFVPPELIAACGFLPVRYLPDRQPQAPRENRTGFCPYAQCLLEKFLSDSSSDPIIITSLCDQQRRMADVLAHRTDRPVFLMHVPATWQRPQSHQYYQNELKRLVLFLHTRGGKTPDDAELISWMRRFDRLRTRLREIQDAIPVAQFISLLLESDQHAEDLDLWLSKCPRRTDSELSQTTLSAKISLALIGESILPRDFLLYDFIEKSGGRIALHGTELSERTFPAPYQIRDLDQDPWLELSQAYFSHIPHPFRRPNTLFYQWLKKEIDQRQIRGIILHRYTWCDLWHGEYARLKEWSPVPVLELESSDGGDGVQRRNMVRLQAFLEMKP